jgi:CRP/FNR family transcriptional regulator, anaerobic regulatory protein
MKLPASATGSSMAGTLAALLSPQSLLAALPASLLQQLAQLPLIELPAATPVFDRNARCGGFPLLLSGAVRVFRPLANGRSIELYRVAPSEPCILSLGCLLGGDAYPACGITAESTTMIVMPPPMFDECMATVAPFRTAMFRLLGERLVNVMLLVEEVATLRLDARLAAALLAHAAHNGDGAPIPITHQQLADELGTVREIISRLLDDFARQQMLVLGRGRIEITAPKQLRQLADAR